MRIRTLPALLTCTLAVCAHAHAADLLHELDASGVRCLSLAGARPNEPDGTLKLGRVVGSGRAAFSPVLPSACTSDPASCRGLPRSPYALPGNLLAVGQAVSGFVCAHRTDGHSVTDGWLPAGRVQVVAPEQIIPPPSLSTWRGTWRAVEGENTIMLRPDGEALRVKGEASWQGPNSVSPHVGYLGGRMKPVGNTITFSESNSDADCVATLMLFGRFLAVVDNHACGGMNVSFSGLYRRTQR